MGMLLFLGSPPKGLLPLLLAGVLVTLMFAWAFTAEPDTRKRYPELCRDAAEALGYIDGTFSVGGGFGPNHKCYAYNLEIGELVEVVQFRSG